MPYIYTYLKVYKMYFLMEYAFPYFIFKGFQIFTKAFKGSLLSSVPITVFLPPNCRFHQFSWYLAGS